MKGRCVKIPKRVWLAGIPIETVIDNTLVEKEGRLGKAVYQYQHIVMDMDAAPTETTTQAYLHELIHWILYVMYEHELRDNEQFVDVLSHLLYQALTTTEEFENAENILRPLQKTNEK